jgi:hypothetical protein
MSSKERDACCAEFQARLSDEWSGHVPYAPTFRPACIHSQLPDLTMHEASQHSQPLLLNEDIESTPVFPIIHMIRTVCSVTFLIDLLLLRRNGPQGRHGEATALHLFLLLMPLLNPSIS